jgi:parvulin-like peptidyl-prolyl isomerase
VGWLGGLIDVRFAFILAVLAGVAAADAPKPDPSKRVVADRVVAIVNDQVILSSEVDLRMLPLRADAARIADVAERDHRLRQLAGKLVESMIDDELMLQAAREAKLTVEPGEVDAAIDYIMKEHHLDKKAVEEAMREQGVTRTTLHNDLMRQRAVSTLIAPKIKIADADVKAEYDRQQKAADSISAVNIDQIVFALPAKPTKPQRDAAVEAAQRAVDRIRGGETFAAVGKALAGGDVIASDNLWIEANTAIPQIANVVFSMDKGDVRGPVVTPTGVYVITANELRRTQLKPYAELAGSIRENLRERELMKQMQAWLAELRKKAYIEIKARPNG